MGQSLVFLSTAEGVRYFSRICQKNPDRFGDCTCVPLSTETAVHLSRQGVPYTDTLPFFTNSSHERVLLKSEEMIKLMESFLDTEDPAFLYFLSSFRLILNYILWLSEVIVNAADQLKPSRVFIDQAGELVLDPFSSQVSPHDDYAGHLIRFMADRDHITFTSIAGGKSSRKHLKRVSNKNFHSSLISAVVKRKASKHLSGVPVAVFTSRGYYLQERIPREMNRSSGMKSLALDFSPVTGIRTYLKMALNVMLERKEYSFKTADFPVIPIPLFPFHRTRTRQRQVYVKKQLTAVSEKINHQWKTVFDYRGMDVAHCLSQKIISGMIPHLNRWLKLECQLNGAMDLLDARAVFTPFSTGIYGVIGDWCRKHHVPGLMVHHGALAPPKTSLEEIEWRRLSQSQMLSPYRYNLAQTPRAADHAVFYKAGDRTFNTGPVILSGISDQAGKELRNRLDIPVTAPVVLYAVAQRQRTSMRFHIFETEDETLSTMKDVIRAVEKLDGVHLILKLHPAYRLPSNDLKHILPVSARSHILRKEPFDQVLSASDLLVSSLSTTIEEALINRIPVVLYNKWKRYNYLDAVDCSDMGEAEWPVTEALYTSNEKQIHLIIKHMLSHREEIQGNRQLFKKHMFHPNRVVPVSEIFTKVVQDSFP